MRLTTILAGAGVILVAGAAVIAAAGWTRPATPAVAAPATPVATAAIERGMLRDIKTVTGTLSYGELNALRPSFSASATLTWIAPVGTVVERGSPLYALDSQPTILFYGWVPQHRTLRFDRDAPAPVWVELEEAATAEKVAELNMQREQALLADAQARTADATARLADALSITPTMAEFVELSGAVRAAQAKLGRVHALANAELTPTVDVAAAQAEIAAARAAFDAAVRAVRRDLSGAALDVVTARAAIGDAEAKFDELRTAHDTLAAEVSDGSDIQQIAVNLTALGYTGPLPEQIRMWQRDAGLPVTGVVGPSNLFIAPGPVHVATHEAGVGERLVAASPDVGAILGYSSTDKRVTVPLSVGDQGIAALGDTVAITLPGNASVKGTISAIGSVVTAGNIDVTITIADQAALGTLEVASVDVEFVSGGRDDVLSVPVGALIALPEGGFAVEIVGEGERTVVPVRTGLFASGRVEIVGDGIAEGMHVGVPR